ncbi:hypothetical protein RND81_05G197100 [Saponaria officinalis]|uniref:NAB domain-containing protein n=1 Tax=Saponaria officinalis TaxID=3572 RepID=A0AAW1KZ55_SAPOF
MEGKQESHCWWFDSHSSLNCSPWLQSTLSELNEKTKKMLKLVEDDADSFAQRAEMYYKKRPELISMVEDFYRAHRSLAERYDQLKSDRSLRVRSSLRHSASHPEDEHENLYDSVNSLKSVDSFTDVAHSSDESVESEVFDPELEGEKEKLREELNRLRQQNEIQRNQIESGKREKEELFSRLADNINELKKLRQECEAIKGEIPFVCSKQKVDAPTEEVKTLNCDVESLKLYDTEYGERIEVAKKFEAMQKLGNVEAENRHLKKALVLKEILLKHEEDEKMKVKIELEKIRGETKRKDEFLIETLKEKDEEKRAVIRQLCIAMEFLREDNRYLKKIVRDVSKKGSASRRQTFVVGA